ncbi:molybdenum cofactor guanylyltransferase [Sphingomonas sp. GC_Shp_4]|uniref:molybdenum cofactor guanylyltransferase n=1 Tax=Sphingomonas sp. GC_Shp_4 TaxID=2937382 RepID=UPI00226B1EE2
MLAGGRSSRFGSDKATALFRGRPLLAHMREVGEVSADAVIVIGRAEGVPDLPAPGLGPLGGIAAALDHAADHGFASVLTLPCDMPSVPPGLIEALLRRAPAYCADAPVIGHWPAAVGAQLLAHLDRGEDRSVRRWARMIGAVPIDSPVPLANINTPADLTAL